jgi:glycosyltransferase involved in cell wall biosynthesis
MSSRLDKDGLAAGIVDDARPGAADPDTARPRARSGRRLRIFYALGPGDVVGLYRSVMDRTEPAFQTGLPFSKQFLDWCDEAGAEAHLMSSHQRADQIRYGPHIIENRPKSALARGRGISYHAGSIAYGLDVVLTALRGKFHVAVVDSGTTHWIVLCLLPMLGVPVIAVTHNAFWPMGLRSSRRSSRLIQQLDGLFFRRFAAATACVSPECERQVRQLAGGKPKGPVYQFRPQYLPGLLDNGLALPPHHARPFCVLFLGRIEDFKGVFLIVSIAAVLEKEMPGMFAWKIAGSGPATHALAHQIADQGLGNVVEMVGTLKDRAHALDAFAWSHAVVVPTTSRFAEGLAMTAVEGVIAGRPVVMSSVVPAWEVLGDAAIRAETDDVESFAGIFRKLALDREYYERCRRATLIVQSPFFQPSEGLGAVVGRAINAALSR